MKIAQLSVVSIDYTVSDTDGNVLDSTEGREPLTYLQGTGYLVPGLEKALFDHAVGDSLDLVVPAAEAYGDYVDALVQKVPGELFDGMEVAEGDTFVADTDDGHRPVTVIEVAEDTVTVDANHPLAGMDLRFNVTVLAVREATPEEISHGHVHDGHAHDHDECCGGHHHHHDDDHECCGGHGHEHGAVHECCGGKGHAHDDDHECCGGHGHEHGADHECCGGKGHAHDDDHECCGGHGHEHGDDHECCGGKGHVHDDDHECCGGKGYCKH